MKVYSKKLSTILCVLIVFCLVWGCENKTDKQRKPQLVRKKIVVKDKKDVVAKKAVPAKTETPETGAKPKTDPEKTAKKPIDAKGDSKKDVISPKSDISVTESKPAKKVVVAKKEKLPVKPVKTEPVEPVKVEKKPVEKKAADLPGTKKEPKKTMAKTGSKKNEPLQIWQIGESNSYNPRGKADPFEPLVEEKPIVVAKQRKKRIPRTPLEKISLSQLKLVAIIRGPSGNKACVEEASGKGYIIKKGDYIGLNSGKVVKILSDNIVIEEEVENSIGDLTKRQKEIKLPKPVGD